MHGSDDPHKLPDSRNLPSRPSIETTVPTQFGRPATAFKRVKGELLEGGNRVLNVVNAEDTVLLG